MNKIVVGIFKCECKGRFLCEVEIAGKVELCYVASSAKLDQFVDLINKKVYLLENKGKATRTKYSLFALEVTKENVILLNLNRVNVILKDYLVMRGIDKEQLKSEITLKYGLKADLIYYSIPLVIYEVKTILTRENEAIFPSAKTMRVKNQLKKFVLLLKEGYQIEYCFFILSLKIEEIGINKEEKEIKKLFYEAINLGMNICVYRTIWREEEFHIYEDIKLEKMIIANIIDQGAE